MHSLPSPHLGQDITVALEEMARRISSQQDQDKHSSPPHACSHIPKSPITDRLLSKSSYHPTPPQLQ